MYRGPCHTHIGIDEVGRGPLAGPVTVACVSVDKPFCREIGRIFHEIKGKDSKKLSATEREAWAGRVRSLAREGKLRFGIASCSARYIDKHGLSRALRRAVGMAVRKAGVRPNERLYLDGALHAPTTYKDQQSLIRGDELVLLIGLASILAKVHRDSMMDRLHKRYPQYDFLSNKGYGTAKHRLAIRTFGTTIEHRISFLRNCT